MHSLLLAFLAAPAAPQQPLHLRIDPFGYRPEGPKIAVLREPVTGYDAPAAYAPSGTVQIRRDGDASVAFVAPVVPWNAGQVDATSGDRAWLADFTSLQEPGAYHLFDPATGARSEAFEIRVDPFSGARRAAIRMYFFQRCGGPKPIANAEGPWHDTACHVGNLQDLDCRSVLDPSAATSRDLHGGWHDAGDFNKYVNFADGVVHDLLNAYRRSPAAWGEGLNLPESGNGVPDLLDEVRYELDWMLRMREPDGSLLHKVSVTGFSGASPPSSDSDVRRYGPATGSATISGAGVFAHAARVFGSLPDAGSQAYAQTLRTAAIEAWDWIEANPGAVPSFYNNLGFQSVDAEDPVDEQRDNQVRAALHLAQLTGAAKYRVFFDQNYAAMELFTGWASFYKRGYLEALLEYGELPGATPAVVADIRSAYSGQIDGPFHLGPQVDCSSPYGAWMLPGDHIWGSNRNRADKALMLLLASEHGLLVERAADLLHGAEGYAQYVHGVNAMGYCYLTNMGGLGAENSVDEMYHGWFYDGTPFDNADTSAFGPAPGFLVGGPNRTFAPDPAYNGPALVPPTDQPADKSYLDWNADWPEASWQISEPHIPYQSAYVRMLASLGPAPPPRIGLGLSPLVGGASASVEVGSATPGSLVGVVYAGQPGSFSIQSAAVCLELGLDLGPNPAARLLTPGLASGSGGYSFAVAVPAAVQGLGLLFQAFELTDCLEPRVSAVLERPVN